MGARTRCDRQSAERIMLAVTEVNGCELCAYAHTRLALDAGVSDAQVRALLGAVTTGVPLGSVLVTPVALAHALLQGMRGAPTGP